MDAHPRLSVRRVGGLPIIPAIDFSPRDNVSTMKALVWLGTRDVALVGAPVPDVIEPEDVVVKVTGTTVCGSDLRLYNGEIAQLQEGDILGHEFIGIVDRMGAGVQNLRVGQRVVASSQIACGDCSHCQEGQSSMCERINSSGYGMKDTSGEGFLGYSHFTGGSLGGQAEYVRVPKANVNLLAIPDTVSDEQALFLGDILPTSYDAVVDVGVKAGDVVGIWGLGPIGQCVAKFALMKGASRVIGIDNVPERLAFAREQSGVDTIDFSTDSDVAKSIRQLVPEGLDIAIDCGTTREPTNLAKQISDADLETPKIVDEMLAATREDGNCRFIAAYAGLTKDSHFNVGAKEIRHIGNGQAPVHKHWHELLSLIEARKLDPAFIITHRVPLDDLPALYASSAQRLVRAEKVFVETQFSAPRAAGPELSRVVDWANK